MQSTVNPSMMSHLPHDPPTAEAPPPYSPFDFEHVAARLDLNDQPSTTTYSELPGSSHPDFPPPLRTGTPQQTGTPHRSNSPTCPGCEAPPAANQPPPPPREVMCQAIYDFIAQSPSELSLAYGEMVFVTIKGENGWWLCKRLVKLSEQGWVPATYLQETPEPSRPPPTPLSAGASPSTRQSKGFKSHFKIMRKSSDNVDTLSSLTSSSSQSSDTRLFGLFTWSSVHQPMHHGAELESLKIHRNLSGSSWDYFVEPVIRDSKLLLKVTGFAPVKECEVQGFGGFPTCPHISKSNELWIAYQKQLAHVRSLPKGQRTYEQKSLETRLFRCCYCPTEYRLQIINQRLNHQWSWVESKSAFRVEQWIDVGKCRAKTERGWECLTLPMGSLQQSTQMFDLHGEAPIKSRFENSAEEDPVFCIHEFKTPSKSPDIPRRSTFSPENVAFSPRESRSSGSGASISASVRSSSSASAPSPVGMSPLEQSRSGQSGKLSFRPGKGFAFDTKTK